MLSPGDVLGLTLVYLYLGGVVALTKFLAGRGKGRYNRKVVHILVGNIVFIWWLFDDRLVMALLAAAPFIPLLYLVSPRCPFTRLKSGFLGTASSQGHDLGLVYYAISWTVLALLFFDLRALASVGIVAMAYGDGIGGLVGARYGRRRTSNGKSVEGTAATFLATVTVSGVVLAFYQYLRETGALESAPMDGWVLVGAAVGVGAFVTLLEYITPGQYDNLVVPISTALVLYIGGI
ncbi:MAG: diacylglycerol/polyprenol kinase family protein [Thermoplasmatota archaeon]